MIQELRIKNLALIEDVLVEFEPGFSVFTGETGAGKSILVGAIGLLLGERASTEHVRGGCEEAEVSGVFELGTMKRRLSDLFKHNAIPDDGGVCIVRRVISKSGKNRVLINQVPVPLSVLKTVGDQLIDFHGQHEHQSLLDPQNALKTIDGLPAIEVVFEAYAKAFASYGAAREVLAKHDKRCADLKEKRDVLEFQYSEFKNLALEENEEAKLSEEVTLLSSSAQRIECISTINNVLSSDETALSQHVGLIKKNLETLLRFDTAAQPWVREIESVGSVLSELESFCGDYLEKYGAGIDPSRLDSVNERMAKIQRLKKKYNCDFEGLLVKQNSLKADLDALVNIDADRTVLLHTVQSALADCEKTGKLLSNARKKQALLFDKAITAEMAKLGFNGGLWRTDFIETTEPLPHGYEDAVFMVRTNSGEQILPLIKTASGGEISRLMLAIKTVMAAHDHIPILIFDEIDSGIGGVLATEVAKALIVLGKSHQLLCISHLHQIASVANNHYHVFKEVQGNRTVTQVKKLSMQEKIGEISRMLGGDSAIAKKHAEELLKNNR